MTNVMSKQEVIQIAEELRTIAKIPAIGTEERPSKYEVVVPFVEFRERIEKGGTDADSRV